MAKTIRLKVHSSTPGAEGHIGQVLAEVDDKAADYLIGIKAAVEVNPEAEEDAAPSADGDPESGEEPEESDQDDTEADDPGRPRRNRRNRRA